MSLGSINNGAGISTQEVKFESDYSQFLSKKLTPSKIWSQNTCPNLSSSKYHHISYIILICHFLNMLRTLNIEDRNHITNTSLYPFISASIQHAVGFQVFIKVNLELIYIFKI